MIDEEEVYSGFLPDSSIRCSKTTAQNLVDSYISNIESYKANIEKNFSQMDLSNNDVKVTYDSIQSEISSLCDTLKTKIDTYIFR